ncbi:MAG: helix-turn-helix transcriptional regulator [Clostridia bacterium]|nr:helix-turn-helix transcriptional regulator [Clostridia bacterium]
MKNILLPEIVAVGIYNSDIAVQNREITKNRKTTMFEIEVPIERGGICYINEEAAPIETDMVICAKPGQIRHSRLPFKCYYIHMIVNDGELYDRLMDTPSFIRPPDMSVYVRIFERMCRYYETALEADRIMLYSLVLELVYTIHRQSEKQLYRDKGKSNNYEAIEKAISHIKENLTSELSLSAVAEHVRFSPIHFHNCFKAATGRTLREYVEEQRIKKAANLLVSTSLTLSDIAYECGFSSQSYFSYAFKRKMGLTPRQYAKEMNKRYDK